MYGCQSRKLGLCVLDMGDGVVRQQGRGIVGREQQSREWPLFMEFRGGVLQI